MTLTEKIIAEHAGRPSVRPGENVWIRVDVLMTHDVCGPGTIGIFKNQFGADAKVWDPFKVALIPDHYIFTKDRHAMRNLEILRAFAKEQRLPYMYDADSPWYKGVCHVALAEEGFTVPGQTLFGTDSHTCTAGAFGEFATGIGNTDAAFIMGTGRIWVKVPETLRFILEGTLPDFVTAKDVILRIIGDIGADGATYRAMEFEGDGIRTMDMEERMTLCNMAIEAGGKNGIIAADEKTVAFVKAHTDKAFTTPASDPDAAFAGTVKYRARDLEPVVAKPFSPANVAPARSLKDVKLDQCYIGSCTGGKLEDLKAAARVLAGGRVRTRTVVVPATVSVAHALSIEQIRGRTLKRIFEDAGAKIGPPSCAACLGGPPDTFGRLNGSEVCLSTTNRNFPGRMGSPDSQTYLASPLTVAASALKGRITDPRDVL
ncbi:3-isopropylmalate dehydratase large subunit [bacterium]|nr:3-isopropylmalate dehydratase large subunit [bacterium]